MSSKNVLIVDDEPKVAFFLGKGLERSGHDYDISLAQSGEEALEILKKSRVDLLVTDLRMPGINGLELIRWVKASSPDTRTILITAYGNDEVEAEARRLEAYRYITKPFDIGDFTETVKRALGDVAVSRPGLTVLSDKTFDSIIQQLESLRRDVGARCIFLADTQGQSLAKVGYSEGLAKSTLLALLAGGFATTGELARQFGNGEAANLNFHQGSRYEIYSSNVGDNLFISLVFEKTEQKSRIGLVWLFVRRTVEELLNTLSTAADEAPSGGVGADFGSGVRSELDTLFEGEDSGPREAHVDSAEDDTKSRDEEAQPAEEATRSARSLAESGIDREHPVSADSVGSASSRSRGENRGASGPAKGAPRTSDLEASQSSLSKTGSSRPSDVRRSGEGAGSGSGGERGSSKPQTAKKGKAELYSLEEAIKLGLLPEDFEA
jgi:CheY-like chemotaxis protein